MNLTSSAPLFGSWQENNVCDIDICEMWRKKTNKIIHSGLAAQILRGG